MANFFKDNDDLQYYFDKGIDWDSLVRVTEREFVAAEGDGEDGISLVHAGYDAEERLVGLAIDAQGMGYQDNIRVLYSYSFEQDAIIGFKVLESKETPGLGDKVEIPTLRGKVEMTVPAGTQSGKVFRLRGQGLPRLESRGKGDQLVRVFCEIPNKLTDRQEEILREFLELGVEDPDDLVVVSQRHVGVLLDGKGQGELDLGAGFFRLGLLHLGHEPALLGAGDLRDGDLAEAQRLMAKHDAIEQSLAQARKHAEDAGQCLAALPSSPAKDALIETAAFAASRAV